MKTYHSFLAICLVTSALVSHESSWAIEATADQAQNTTTVDPVDGISSIYSDVDMRMRLATKPNEQACNGDMCLNNQVFDARVQALGQRLAKSAYEVYPDLKKRVPSFAFSVADKKVLGSASNANGAVVIFRGIQHLDLGDEALAFIVGREMGHVIANHHKSNAKTRLLISALAAVLFPAVGILSASSAATQATTATTSLLTSAASTATSIVGSEVAMSRIKPGQLTEADAVSISILEHTGLTSAEVAQSLEFIVERENSTGWEKDLNQSIHYVRQVAGEPKEIVTELEPLPEEYIDEEVSMEMLAESSEEPSVPNSQVAQHVQPPVEQKASLQHKVILITNESIAESHAQAKPVEEKPLTKSFTKRSVDKKGKTLKVKSKSGIKNAASKTKKLKVKSSKKPISSKSSKKANAVKSKVLAKSKK